MGMEQLGCLGVPGFQMLALRAKPQRGLLIFKNKWDTTTYLAVHFFFFMLQISHEILRKFALKIFELVVCLFFLLPLVDQRFPCCYELTKVCSRCLKSI